MFRKYNTRNFSIKPNRVEFQQNLFTLPCISGRPKNGWPSVCLWHSLWISQMTEISCHQVANSTWETKKTERCTSCLLKYIYLIFFEIIRYNLGSVWWYVIIKENLRIFGTPSFVHVYEGFRCRRFYVENFIDIRINLFSGKIYSQ